MIRESFKATTYVGEQRCGEVVKLISRDKETTSPISSIGRPYRHTATLLGQEPMATEPHLIKSPGTQQEVVTTPRQ
jgi:hypothetical protein